MGKIGIIGAGAWGTALASVLQRAGNDVVLQAYEAETANYINIKGEKSASNEDIADLCASFQQAITEVVVDRCRKAIDIFLQRHDDGKFLVVAGGVASNQALREALKPLTFEKGISLIVPPPNLCTDNGAMIAWAGLERLKLNLIDGLDFAPRPRWPLDPLAAPAIGAGVKA